MKAYKYDSLGLFVKEVERQEDPMNEGSYLMPANCTDVEPPTLNAPYVARWNGTAWESIEDHRRHLDDTGTPSGGTPYWLPSEGDDYNSEPRYMTELGALPEGAVTVKPEKPQSVIHQEELESTIAEAKAYLSETDYAVIKCGELGLDLETEYPGLKAERQAKRDLINQAEAQVLALNLDD